MNASAIASIVFVCVFGGGMLGLYLRALLPEHHLKEESTGVVKLGTGLIGTLAALVLGLLIASAKSNFDRISDDVAQNAAKVVLLDRALAGYGPETNEARDLLRRAFAATVEVFSDGGPVLAKLDAHQRVARFEQVQGKLRELTPRNDAQRLLQSRALELSNDLQQMRWLLIEQGQGSIPTPFLVVLVLWLVIIFAGFGLVSANNATVVTTFLLCALSVSGSIYLIEELNSPLDGLLKISSAPLQNALNHLGH
jgi:ABC-type amino acid transport system permease subunit